MGLRQESLSNMFLSLVKGIQVPTDHFSALFLSSVSGNIAREEAEEKAARCKTQKENPYTSMGSCCKFACASTAATARGDFPRLSHLPGSVKAQSISFISSRRYRFKKRCRQARLPATTAIRDSPLLLLRRMGEHLPPSFLPHEAVYP